MNKQLRQYWCQAIAELTELGWMVVATVSLESLSRLHTAAAPIFPNTKDRGPDSDEVCLR